MTEQCSFLISGICRHPVIGPAIVRKNDCDSCIAFNGRESPELDLLRQYRDGLTTSATFQTQCKYLGTKLGLAPCCGQMFACNFHKGKKCAPVGIAKQPFLSCSTCDDFAISDAEYPRVGFIAASFMAIGGTETFHKTLLPQLKERFNIVGFVATDIHGGDGRTLGVPYAVGQQHGKQLASNCDVLISWGIDRIESFLPSLRRPKVIAVHHADTSSDWSNNQILNQLDVIDEVVCVNEGVAKLLSSCGKPIHFIPNAIDPERIKPSGKQRDLRFDFGIREESKIVLFGHRMSDEKRPELAVQIAKLLPPDWMMVMAGDGHAKQASETAANESDRVRFAGECESLADWLAISDCFLSLATIEGFGLSIAEAMMAGVPTVSTPTGIAPGLAITLPVESAAYQWVSAILNSQNWTKPSDIGERFSVDKMVDAWANAIRKISATNSELNSSKAQTVMD